MSEIPLSELGNSLRCPKDKEFGTIVRQDIQNNSVTLYFECTKCGNKFRNSYSHPQYQRMASMGLIDKPQIINYQKQLMIRNGEYVQIDGGMDGAFVITKKWMPLIQQGGKILMCKCGSFYSVTIKKMKKNIVELTLYCTVCAPKGKKAKMHPRSILALGKAGFVEPDVVSKIRDSYKSKNEKEFDTSETYLGNDGTLSSWTQESLGMTGEGAPKKCYICGARISEDMGKCPKCGSDTDL